MCARRCRLVDHCEACGRHIIEALHSSRSVYGLQCFLVGFAFLRLSLILGTVLLIFHPPISPDNVLY
jgi:hypothetical protein